MIFSQVLLCSLSPRAFFQPGAISQMFSWLTRFGSQCIKLFVLGALTIRSDSFYPSSIAARCLDGFTAPIELELVCVRTTPSDFPDTRRARSRRFKNGDDN